MTASAIAISSNSSDESVGSSPSRVSVFGNIPTVIPSTSVVAPETSTISILLFICRSCVSIAVCYCDRPGIGFVERPAILIRPGEAIPFGRPYRTHLNRSRKLLTARKRVGPLPARRLACRYASPRSSDTIILLPSLSLDSVAVHYWVLVASGSGLILDLSI
ncbi:hypothetical protein Tco_0083674 [Tanacetum coccineum]